MYNGLNASNDTTIKRRSLAVVSLMQQPIQMVSIQQKLNDNKLIATLDTLPANAAESIARN